MPEGPAAPGRDWLSLGPASRVVGVNPGTLRRWADEGRVVAFTTLGGHRRFDRIALERLASGRRPATADPFTRLRATSDGFSRAYRRSYRTSSPSATAAAAAAGPDREAFRQDGRRLVEALLAYLETSSGPHGVDAPAVPDKDAPHRSAARNAAEVAASDLTDDLAARLAGAGVSLTGAVELFVAARRPFLAELGLLAGRRGLEPAALSALYEDAAGLLDRLLLRLIATHQAGDAKSGGG